MLSEAEMISDIPNADARMGRRRTGDIVWNVNIRLLEGGYHHGAPYTTTITSNNEIDRWIDVIIAEMTKDKAVEVINQYAP